MLYMERVWGGQGRGILYDNNSGHKFKSCTDLNFFSLLLFISFLLFNSLHTVKTALIFIS